MELAEAQDLSKVKTAGLLLTARISVYWAKDRPPCVVVDGRVLSMDRFAAATGLDLTKLATSKKWVPTRARWDADPLMALAWCAE